MARFMVVLQSLYLKSMWPRRSRMSSLADRGKHRRTDVSRRQDHPALSMPETQGALLKAVQGHGGVEGLPVVVQHVFEVGERKIPAAGPAAHHGLRSKPGGLDGAAAVGAVRGLGSGVAGEKEHRGVSGFWRPRGLGKAQVVNWPENG